MAPVPQEGQAAQVPKALLEALAYLWHAVVALDAQANLVGSALQAALAHPAGQGSLPAAWLARVAKWALAHGERRVAHTV